jgi:NhaP-type Na+/H+ or K+/H+ antiporter
VFLGLGAVIGPYGLGIVDVGVNSPILRVVATLSLALVLFTDALSLNIAHLRAHKLLGFLVLGPGTVLLAFLISIAGLWLLSIPFVLAVMLGAALASTDPVLLRGIIRQSTVSGAVRQALKIESGLNDVVLLPIVLVAITAATRHAELGPGEWAKLALNIGVLSPAAGIVVALSAIGALELVRRQMGVRRDYESIYSLGVAFAAFALAESMHGSGFIAAFAAGLTIAALDVELCDCFLEYGETTAEMALLFTFVLFGMSLIWTGVAITSPRTLLFAGAVFLLRPLALFPTLSIARLSFRDRALLGWFGPRGLSSLLLILLPVFAGVAGSEFLLSVCCLVVLFSVLLHGLTPMFLPKTEAAPVAQVAVPQSPTAPNVPLSPTADAEQPELIDVQELRALSTDGTAPVTLVDVRSTRSYDESPQVLAGAVRLDPERAVAHARQLGLPQDALIALFCT